MKTVIARVSALFEGVMMALDSIRSNRVRAGLTILGIAVGVFVVTVMSAAVHGINAGVSASISAAGPTTFFITRWPVQMNSCTGSADSCPWRHNPSLTLDQARQIGQLADVRAVTAHISSNAPIKFADRELGAVSVDGYTPEWFDVAGGDISKGRNFTPQENDAGAPVALVNSKIVDKLFLGADPVGKTVRLGGSEFTIIGVYDPIPNAFDSGDNGKVVVPILSAYRRLNFGLRWLDLTVKPNVGVNRDAAMDEVIALLRSTRHLRPATENDFFVSTPEKVLELYNKIVGVFFLVMITLSAIGLLVGGVGVIAIMMISVTERTREIGVRKALGATKGVILWQFLVEAATLTTLGAVVGLAVGGGLTYIVRHATPIDASTPPVAILIALLGSAFAGIVFGLLPAVRAAGLDPVEALRYE
ncbi:MAG TPA: ABC transporter permease [Gemmatimonadaceae bacterium]|nr:ABC transporter permease [Gemmatimonadaceae bacterium]